MTHGVDAIGTHVHAFSKFPDARMSSPAADNGVVPFAIKTMSSCLFFQTVQGNETFDKDVHQLDKETKLLHGDDQGLIFIPKMPFHELRGLPIDQLTFGGVGAPFSFRGFQGNYPEFARCVKDGFAWWCIGMRQGPFEHAMNDQVGVAPDRRSEVSVLVKSQREMPQRLIHIASLLERTQHQIRQDSFFRLAGDLLCEPLVMLRPDLEVLSVRKRDDHRAVSRTSILPAAAPRAGKPPMADGYALFRQIGDPQRISKSVCELFEFKDFLRVWLFMNAVQRRNAARFEIFRHCLIGNQHKLLDQAMRNIPLTPDDSGHLPFGVKREHPLGKIEIDRASPGASLVENQRQIPHIAKSIREGRVTRVGHRITLDNLIYRGIGHPLGRTNHAGDKFRIRYFSTSIEMEKHAHHEAVFMRIQRANTIGKLFGEHGHSTIRKVDGCASQTSLTVKGRVSFDIMGDVGNMHLKMPAVGTFFNVNGIIKVARCLSVDSHNGQEAKISASFESA